MKIYALIINGVVENTIKADESFIEIIMNDFDSIIEITNDTRQPGIGWTYDENGFRPPKPSPNHEWDETLNNWVIPVVEG